MSAHLAMCAACTCDHATHILDPINTIRTQTRQSKLIVTNLSSHTGMRDEVPSQSGSYKANIYCTICGICVYMILQDLEV